MAKEKFFKSKHGLPEKWEIGQTHPFTNMIKGGTLRKHVHDVAKRLGITLKTFKTGKNKYLIKRVA